MRGRESPGGGDGVIGVWGGYLATVGAGELKCYVILLPYTSGQGIIRIRGTEDIVITVKTVAGGQRGGCYILGHFDGAILGKIGQIPA